jgi:hypothetical protein
MIGHQHSRFAIETLGPDAAPTHAETWRSPLDCIEALIDFAEQLADRCGDDLGEIAAAITDRGPLIDAADARFRERKLRFDLGEIGAHTARKCGEFVMQASHAGARADSASRRGFRRAVCFRHGHEVTTGRDG